MDTKLDRIFQRMHAVGSAIGMVNGNNTHSGNISMRDPDDDDLFYISSSGSQTGALVPTDITPLRFTHVVWGDGRASTESIIHRKILSLPGINAATHCHFLYMTFISFDTKETNLFLRYLGNDEKGREEFSFVPIDLYGAYAVGEVKIESYFQPVGSVEMEERIPKYLKDNVVTIVRGHGPFAKGTSLEDALYRVSTLESSAKLAFSLRRRGVNIVELQNKIVNFGIKTIMPFTPHLFSLEMNSICEVTDQTIIDDFKQRMAYNYYRQLSAYGTGSMSQKVSSNRMIYSPMSACPEGLTFPLFNVELDEYEYDSIDMKLHKLIYHTTHLNTCMITTNPFATAEGMAILAKRFDPDVLLGKDAPISYTLADHPVIKPIDAEAIYLNPRVGLVDMAQLSNLTSTNPILNMLRWHKGCCVVAGYGVISAGEKTLEQCAHNASSAERIAQFRQEVDMNNKVLGGPSLESFEP
ncbi:class II aldolase/adducin family protein [candidate division KSB1 bacterium]|nr:class II aldolase/adducin family protein [candidate division KSB1 bacterium]